MQTMREPLTITQVDDTERPTFGKFQVVEAAGTGHAYVVAELWYRHGSREQYVEAQMNANKIAAIPDMMAALRGLVCELDSVQVPAPGLTHARAAISKAERRGA